MIRSWFRFACSRRRLASYERLPLTVRDLRLILPIGSSLLERNRDGWKGMKGSLATIDRLVRATNLHDIDAIAACFSDDYVNETPAHPARGFRGRAQVRRNCEQILAFVPDIRVEVVRSAVKSDNVWTEWEMRGTRRDGRSHWTRGVIFFGVSGDAIHWARFYVEPVDESDKTVDDAIREQVVRQ